MFLYVSFEFTFLVKYYVVIYFAVSLGVFSSNKVSGKMGAKKNSWIIRKLNKALGLGRKSKKVWDILSISDNKANIEKYHPHKTSKCFGVHKLISGF